MKGLVVPVIRNSDQLNFAEIEKYINTLAKKATAGTISIDEMAGGTFTISNGGVYGSLLSMPIINPPQVLLHTKYKQHLLVLFLDGEKKILFNLISLLHAVCYFGHALYSHPPNGCWGQHSPKANDVHCIDI